MAYFRAVHDIKFHRSLGGSCALIFLQVGRHNVAALARAVDMTPGTVSLLRAILDRYAARTEGSTNGFL